MPTILLTNSYKNKPLEIVESVLPEGFRLVVLNEADQKELEEKANIADYFLVSGRLKINKSVLENATKLKMIQRTGVGLDSLDLEMIKERDIPLYVNKGVNSTSVAEHTILLILATLRKLNQLDQNTKKGIWNKQAQGVSTRELRGKTVGLIGMGSIGQAVARMLSVFDVKVNYFDKSPLSSEEETKLQVSRVELDELYKVSDIVSIHTPLCEDTRGLIDNEAIDKMKDGVILVNTARGPIINEEALIRALELNKIAYAGLDVYEIEPPEMTRLFKQANVITTPHIGGVTYDSFYSMMQDAMRNIRLYEEGKLEEIQQYKYEG